MSDQPGWEDFEPKTERDRMALALLEAGIVLPDPAGGEGVLLDYPTADRVLESLAHVVGSHPDEPHEFPTVCSRCGKRGNLVLSLIAYDQQVRVEPREPITFAGDRDRTIRVVSPRRTMLDGSPCWCISDHEPGLTGWIHSPVCLGIRDLVRP